MYNVRFANPDFDNVIENVYLGIRHCNLLYSQNTDVNTDSNLRLRTKHGIFNQIPINRLPSWTGGEY